ncbi:site-specific integrase [Planktomarina temperata]|jgi:integrase|nr:site-specific integrase [Planktomarina temperata]
MGLGKQAKTLSRTQVKMISEYLLTNRYGLRDQTIFYLSTKAGLRAKEIAHLKWSMVMNSDGSVGDYLNLPNSSSKGNGGRVVPLNKDLKLNLIKLLQEHSSYGDLELQASAIVRTERSKSTSSQAIVNMFQRWYYRLGLIGCSSHSGRRTFITNAARKISTVGGSLRDVQMLAGHSSLAVTQRYIEGDSEARQKIVDLI